MPKENNKMQVDIENLFKQNVNDLSAIKELYRKLQDMENKILQIKYIDSNLANKLKKEYEKLKRIILDENIQAKIANDIKIINSHLETNTKQINGIVNVKFPPKGMLKAVGNGVNDDSKAINESIIYAIKNKMSVYIPAGVYRGNFKIDYETLFSDTPTWEECSINISIFGDGDSTILTNNTGTIFSINSCPLKEKYFRFITLKDFQIIGDGKENNPPPVKGMNLVRYQQLNVSNIRILKCGNGGVHIWGGFDSQWNNIDIIFCGHATSDSDYAYALQLRNSITPISNSNANKFTNIRIEKAPCMFWIDGDCKENYIENFKFEKGTINNLNRYRPVLIDYCGDMNFQNGMFVNNQSTFDDGVMQENEQFKYFLVSNINDNIKSNTTGYSERVKFTNCDFVSANSWQSGSWVKGSNITLIGCSINGGMGDVGTSELGNVRQPPIHFTDNCFMKDCTTQTFWKSRNLKISGQFNNVDFMIMNKRANNLSVGMVVFDDVAKNNNVNVTIECLGFNKIINDISPFEIPDSYKMNINTSSPLNLGSNTFKIKNNTILNTFSAGGTVYNNFVDIITFDTSSEVKALKHVYDGYKVTFIAKGSLKILNTGNLVTNDSTEKQLTQGQTITFIFVDGIGYEI